MFFCFLGLKKLLFQLFCILLSNVSNVLMVSCFKVVDNFLVFQFLLKGALFKVHEPLLLHYQLSSKHFLQVTDTCDLLCLNIFKDFFSLSLLFELRHSKITKFRVEECNLFMKLGFQLVGCSFIAIFLFL